MESNLAIDLLICAFGLALHLCSKWQQARAEAPSKAERPTLGQYVADVPALTIMAVLASALAFLSTWALGWMNPGMAAGCGYMGNSLVDNMARHFEQLAASRTP